MSSSTPTPGAGTPPDDSHQTSVMTPRRGVLVQLLTAAISFVLVSVPATLGGLFFLDPILRKRKTAEGGAKNGELQRKDELGFIRLNITRDDVPEDGTPLAITVLDDIVDAWNRFKNVPIGSIWLRKVGDGPILALNSICPHLGCSVDYRGAENVFYCPCHTSSFALDGTKTNDIPPRDMDTLEVSMRTNGADDPKGQEIWVRYQKFQGATAKKIPV